MPTVIWRGRRISMAQEKAVKWVFATTGTHNCLWNQVLPRRRNRLKPPWSVQILTQRAGRLDYASRVRLVPCQSGQETAIGVRDYRSDDPYDDQD